MSQDMVYDFKQLASNFKNFAINEEGNAVNWTKLRILHVKSSGPMKLFYKNEYREIDYQVIDLLRKARGKKINLKEEILVPMRQKSIPISAATYKDVCKLAL